MSAEPLPPELVCEIFTRCPDWETLAAALAALPEYWAHAVYLTPPAWWPQLTLAAAAEGRIAPLVALAAKGFDAVRVAGNAAAAAGSRRVLAWCAGRLGWWPHAWGAHAAEAGRVDTLEWLWGLAGWAEMDAAAQLYSFKVAAAISGRADVLDWVDARLADVEQPGDALPLAPGLMSIALRAAENGHWEIYDRCLPLQGRCLAHIGLADGIRGRYAGALKVALRQGAVARARALVELPIEVDIRHMWTAAGIGGRLESLEFLAERYPPDAFALHRVLKGACSAGQLGAIWWAIQRAPPPAPLPRGFDAWGAGGVSPEDLALLFEMLARKGCAAGVWFLGEWALAGPGGRPLGGSPAECRQLAFEPAAVEAAECGHTDVLEVLRELGTSLDGVMETIWAFQGPDSPAYAWGVAAGLGPGPPPGSEQALQASEIAANEVLESWGSRGGAVDVIDVHERALQAGVEFDFDSVAHVAINHCQYGLALWAVDRGARVWRNIMLSILKSGDYSDADALRYWEMYLAQRAGTATASLDAEQGRGDFLADAVLGGRGLECLRRLLDGAVLDFGRRRYRGVRGVMQFGSQALLQLLADP